MEGFEMPTIASDIWSTRLPENTEDSHPPAAPKFRTENRAIDAALSGGLCFGAVHCITAQADHGAQDLALGLLATHLLSAPTATATLIHSTLGFDVRKLHRAIRSGMPAGQDAMEPLRRLKISQVFDREGMMEAIVELRDALEVEMKHEAERKLQPLSHFTTVEDSEGEEEEIIPEAEPTSVSPTPASGSRAGPARLLLVDSISHVMAPMIKNDYAHGQALLTFLMRSLAHVTHRHKLCTIGLCEAAFKLVPEDETLSHFKSCRIKPAVGDGIGYLVDVHLYLHKLLMKVSTSEGIGDGKIVDVGEGKRSVSVLEIVQDRSGNLGGSWACFGYTPDERLRDVL